MKTTHPSKALRAVLALSVVASSGCAAILGIEEPEPREETRGWTFDDSEDSWDVIAWNCNGETCAWEPGVDFDGDEGDPDPGVLVLEIPFDGPNQQVSFGVNTDGELDLTGETLNARILIDTGVDDDLGAYPAYARFYVEGADGCQWQSQKDEGNLFDTDGTWFHLEVDVDDSWESADTSCEFDVSEIVQLGVIINNAFDAATPREAVLFLDSVTY
jgi:hypothetical protein